MNSTRVATAAPNSATPLTVCNALSSARFPVTDTLVFSTHPAVHLRYQRRYRSFLYIRPYEASELYILCPRARVRESKHSKIIPHRRRPPRSCPESFRSAWHSPAQWRHPRR